MVQWSRLHLLIQGLWVQPLVKDLKSHIPQGQKKPNKQTKKKQQKNIKQKQYCNKFNTDFKNGPYQKKFFSHDHILVYKC